MHIYTRNNVVVRALNKALIHYNLLTNPSLCAILIQSTYRIEYNARILMNLDTHGRFNIILPIYMHKALLQRIGGDYAEYYEL